MPCFTSTCKNISAVTGTPFWLVGGLDRLGKVSAVLGVDFAKLVIIRRWGDIEVPSKPRNSN